MDEPLRDVDLERRQARRVAALHAQQPATVGSVLRELARARRRDAAGRAPQPPRPPQPPPAAPPPVVRTLSYSSLAAWEACGYRFYLSEGPAPARGARDPRRGGGRARPAGAPTLDPRVRGSLVHALLEQPGPARPSASPRVAADHGVELTPAEAADVARLTDAFDGVAAGGADRARAPGAPRARVRRARSATRC